MKRIFKPLLLAIMAGFMFSSCIKDEALNTEADITGVTVEGTTPIRPAVITNNEIRFYVNGWEDLRNVALNFTLTDGATMEPANGTVRDFSQPQTYTITSQDGQWRKTYRVSFLSDNVPNEFHFDDIKWHEYKDEFDDNAEVQRLYQIFTDKTAEGQEVDWGSGNAGFMITASGQPAENYPTSQTDEGYQGKAAKLVTRSTGTLGAMFGSPIAAGNLFMGTFKLNLEEAAKSTHFGLPFRQVPRELVGYYKYKAGESFTDKSNNVVAGRKDDFAIYAVLFETDDNVPYLDGTNSLTSDHIVLKAELTDRKETDEWTRFSISFNPVEGRTIDQEKLRNGKYSLAIVMSSSRAGATFEGAVGSTLLVDEFQLFTE